MTDTKTTADDLREYYLDLIKRSLTGALAEDNDSILGGVRMQGAKSMKKRAANAVAKAAGRLDLEISYKKPYDPAARESGQDWPARAESMIGLKRMTNIQDCIAAVIKDGVPGDLIETGVWRGGATIFMKANLKAWGDTTRKVWVADSFEGLPAPDSSRYPADSGDELYTQTGLAVGLETVKNNFRRYDVLDDHVEFLVGWFKDTLPVAPLGDLALMRLDGDMYESTIQAIEVLYPKLSPGGFCIIDDFGSHASQAGQAIHDYRKQHGITEEIVQIDEFGAYWRKTF
ncbi:macrocin O-methyltransferase [Aeromicrobium sp. A1-2]|uniref:TylF/MycF/NovP-related O-methyltransferase n=1 Tax=Aeromicrobium sp. A1-2 TaxID=2107713 RepID=UPI000E4C8FE8|nr:TylF/MycF/NovP-related O-methyltransferase [Aeromicrobium sp. A1-2]AXT86207.1 macrocin O-methyltransferase [Aeromicrobium sp. A1-2]